MKTVILIFFNNNILTEFFNLKFIIIFLQFFGSLLNSYL